MTPTELDNALDAMQLAAAGNPDLMPGLITVNSTEWCASFSELERSTRTLDDGTRHREIKVVVSSLFATRVLARAEAGDRGAPYRDLTPRD